MLDGVIATFEGMGNLDNNGITNNSPIEVRRSFPLFLSPFLRFAEAEEVLLDVIGGP